MSEQGNPMGKIIAKALKDECFKKKLIADPAGTLKDEGIEVPAGKTLKVVADTDSVRHLVLPALSGKLSEEEIFQVSAAGGWEDDCSIFIGSKGKVHSLY